MSQNGQAERALDFINSIGVNTHLTYYNTAYANETGVVADLEFLGIDHVRDAAPITSNQAYWAPYQQDMADGIKFDLVIPKNALNIITDITELNALQAANPGGIDAVEGVNEGDASTTFAGLTGDAAINAFQAQLFAAVRNDPQLAGVNIYNYTLNTYSAAARTQFGNTSAQATFGNAHVYFGYYAPQVIIPQILPSQLLGTPNDPFVVTETGYDTMPGLASDGSQGVNGDVQAKYTLDDILDLVSAGASMVYVYELLDELPDPNMTDHEQHFGLFNNNGTPKEAAVVLHDLTTILADPGATAATFTTGTLAYTIANLPSTGHSLLLQKSNGAFDLAIWAEPPIWNPATLQEIGAPATSVTVSLGQMAGTVEVFDPFAGTAPIASYSNVSQIAVLITDHPQIIEIDPLTAPALSGVPATQTATKTIAPFATLQLGDSAAQDTATITLSATTFGTFGNLGTGSYSVATGVYTVSGTPAAVAAALQQLTFTPATASTTIFNLTVSSQTGTSRVVTSISDTAPLAKPTFSGVPLTQAAGPVITPFANLQLTDAATDGASVQLLTTTQGTLGNFGIGTYSAATGIYAVSGTPAQVAAALQHLTFTPTAGAAMAYTTTFSYGVSNQAGSSGYVTSIIGAAPLPAPVLSGVPATQIVSGTISPFAGLQVTNLTLQLGAGVQLSSTAQGTLGNFGIGTYAAATGAYSVNSTPAQVTAALQRLTFTPATSTAILTTTSLTLGVSNAVGGNSLVTTVAEINQSRLPVPTAETPIAVAWTGAAGTVPPAVTGAYNEAVVAAPASGAQIVAPSGFQAVLAGGTNAVQLIDTNQGGIILAGNAGNDTLQASRPNDTLIGGTGSNRYIVTGADTVIGGTGTISITASGANQLQLGTGTASISSTGGDTIFGGSGAVTIAAGTGDTVFAGSGALTFIGGTGTSMITDSFGAILLTAPSQVIVSAASETVATNGGMFQKVALLGGGNRTINCGNGAETVDASQSTGANVLIAGGGNDQLIGGSGNTTIFAGRGNDQLSGAGHTLFEFINGNVGGNDVISGFNAAIDSIVMQGYTNTAIAAAVQGAQTIGSSTLLQLTDGTNITLAGVTGVSSSWFTASLH